MDKVKKALKVVLVKLMDQKVGLVVGVACGWLLCSC